MEMKNSEKESMLSTVKPSKAIVELAIPATLALLAKAVYNIVDTAYIGMLHSDIALAAVGGDRAAGRPGDPGGHEPAGDGRGPVRLRHQYGQL